MEREIAFRRLMEQVKRFYQSMSGRTLSRTDWVAFQEAVEEFDRLSEGSVFGPSKSSTPEFLLQKAEALQLLIPDESTLTQDARRIVSEYDFVFQVVRDLNKGLIVSQVIDAALQRKGLRLNVDLGPFELDLNNFRSSVRVFPDSSVSGPYWDLYRMESLGEGHEEFEFKFAGEGIAHFHRQKWTIDVMGVTAVEDYSRELYDTIAGAFARAWGAEPARFERPPLLAARLVRTTFKDGQGFKETLYRYVAPGVPPPPESGS